MAASRCSPQYCRSLSAPRRRRVKSRGNGSAKRTTLDGICANTKFGNPTSFHMKFKFVAGEWDNESDENVIESVTLTCDYFELGS